jgi:hypothetical protein
MRAGVSNSLTGSVTARARDRVERIYAVLRSAGIAEQHLQHVECVINAIRPSRVSTPTPNG